jgi:hypothetical protein
MESEGLGWIVGCSEVTAQALLMDGPIPRRAAHHDNRCSPEAVSRAMRIIDAITKTTAVEIRAIRT